MTRKEKMVQSKGKKKTAVARAIIRQGNGTIKINGRLIEAYPSNLIRSLILEPIELSKKMLGQNFMDSLDISITVNGGGIMGQAYACRTSIGKSILAWTENEDLKKMLNEIDRTLVTDDVRRKEPKKCLRKGARAKPIKSYR